MSESIGPIVSLGWVLLRTPLLSFHEWFPSGSGTELSTVKDQDQNKIAANPHTQRLTKMLCDPVVREALYWASPTLFEALQEWERDAKSKRREKIEAVLGAFLSRMSGRATPHSLMAGITFGVVGARSLLELPSRQAYRRHTRIDLRVLSALTSHLNRLPAIRRKVSYRPNATIAKLAGKLRYIEPQEIEGPPTVLGYRTVMCDASEALEEVLQASEHGAKLELLVDVLAQKGIPPVDAEPFIQELIEEGILSSDLGPSISGPDPAGDLANQLGRFVETESISRTLVEINDGLREIDSRGMGLPVGSYQGLADKLRAVMDPIEGTRANGFHIDLSKESSSCVIGNNVIDEIARGIETLHLLCPPIDVWRQFRNDFNERFGTREVPLLEALDEELGIRLSGKTNQIADLEPDFLGAGETELRRQAILFQKVISAAETHDITAELTEEDLKALKNPDPGPLLPYFSVFVTLIASSLTSLDIGNFQIYLQNYGFPGGIVGRFCGISAELGSRVRAMIAEEEAMTPELAFAEVLHYPAGEPLGNVLCRPSYSSYEIPLMARSAVPEDARIALSDLTVSVSHNRVVLRSVRLRKEIIPRLTNAHAYIKRVNHSIYRFLCFLQTQSALNGPVWSWGKALEQLSFLPRLSYRRLILAKARWRLHRDQVEKITSNREPESNRFIRKLRRELRMPRYVTLSEGDQQLPVDLEDNLSIKVFRRQLRKRQDAMIVEMLPDPSQLCILGPEGKYVHEFVVPFKAPSAIARRVKLAKDSDNASTHVGSVARRFGPGSEWVYAKIYAVPSVFDAIVIDDLFPFVISSKDRNLTDQWHYLRYRDPDDHIRLRLHCCPPQQRNVLLGEFSTLLDTLLRQGKCRRIQFDTYEREVERYGGDRGVVVAEHIFHADSHAAAHLLRSLRLANGSKAARISMILAGIDSLLDDFSMNLERKIEFIKRVGFELEKRLRFSVHERREVGREHRLFRTEFFASVTARCSYSNIFEERSLDIRPRVEALRQLARNNLLGLGIERLAESVIHMHVNRMLRSPDLKQEVAIYEFLRKTYVEIKSRSQLIDRRATT